MEVIMNFWYGIIRDRRGKIRFNRISENEAKTQDEFLKLMSYNSKYDTIVELDFGNHMTNSEFASYVIMVNNNNIVFDENSLSYSNFKKLR